MTTKARMPKQSARNIFVNGNGITFQQKVARHFVSNIIYCFKTHDAFILQTIFFLCIFVYKNNRKPSRRQQKKNERRKRWKAWLAIIFIIENNENILYKLFAHSMRHRLSALSMFSPIYHIFIFISVFTHSLIFICNLICVQQMWAL